MKIRHLRSVQGVAARLLMTSSAGDGYRCGLLWCCCWVASLACHADEVSNRWWDGQSRARGAMENCNENVYDDSTKQSSSISHLPARMPSRSRSKRIQMEGATTRPASVTCECKFERERLHMLRANTWSTCTGPLPHCSRIKHQQVAVDVACECNKVAGKCERLVGSTETGGC